MRVFIAVLVLIFSFQSWVRADDIRDLEIEGMSIGDSLLDHFSEEEIKNNKQTNQYPNDLFIVRNFYKHKNFKKYDAITAIHLKKDKKYIIESIGALVVYDEIKNCLNEKIEIEKEFDELFKNSDKDSAKIKKSFDKTGESIAYITEYYLDKSEVVQVVCNDWSERLKKENFSDTLAINLQSKKFRDFLNIAYQN